MTPLISVIVPVYNVEKYLNKCVESIVNQTYENLEIILVDDGSPDNCPRLCDEWAERDGRIKVIHKQNGGVSSARNAGIDFAGGEYIAFVDSDDFIDGDMYETLFNTMVSNNIDVAECSITRESPNGNIEHWGKQQQIITIKSKDEALIQLCSTLDLVCEHTGNKLFSKKVIASTRFDTKYKYNEDVLFLYTIMLSANGLVYVDKPMYHFYYNASSASHNKDRASIFDEIDITDELYKLTPEHLYNYCVRGDMLKTFNKIQELAVDGSLTKAEYKMLRQRVKKHFVIVFKSGIFSKFTKIKTVGVLFAPSLFRALICSYGKKEKLRIEGKYLN